MFRNLFFKVCNCVVVSYCMCNLIQDFIGKGFAGALLLLFCGLAMICPPILSTEPVRINAGESEELLHIYADQVQGPFKVRHGYLHGLQGQDTLSDSMIAFLKPHHWRLSKGDAYLRARTHGAQITFVLSDSYAFFKGGYPNAKPWLDWEEYEQYTMALLQAIEEFAPDYAPAYYDIWNEPDHPFFWTGTYDQFLETFVRGYNVVKAFNADAKVVAPSISWFRQGNPGVEGIIEFLSDLDTLYSIRLDAVSWHENGGAFHGGPRPEHLLSNTLYLQSQAEVVFPPSYTPEYHINEFTGTQEHLSPGWTTGYLFYLEAAEIDQAMRSCWNCYSIDSNGTNYWSDCWAGLNGMFMRDGFTPQPVYWVHRAYAEMEGQTRATVGISSYTTVILSVRDDALETLRCLIGRYWHFDTVDVVLQVFGYPYDYSHTRITAERVPNYSEFYLDPPQAIPLPSGPIPVLDTIVPVDTGYLETVLESFADGDAYILTISPAICGDIDADGSGPNVADLTYLVDYLFRGGPPPPVMDAANVDGDNGINVADLTFLVDYLFRGGPEPVCL